MERVELEEDEEDEVQVGGERVAQKMIDPKLPSKEEVEKHMVTHLPFRNWCRDCVRGRGIEMSHKKADPKREREVPEFHMDFAFPGEESVGETADNLIVLVVRERLTKMLLSSVVPSKSTGEFIAKRVAAFMAETGCEMTKVIVKTDQEPAIGAVVVELRSGQSENINGR